MYATMSESKTMTYVNQFVHLFKVLLLHLISLQYSLSLIFHLDCTRRCRFLFLTHVSTKSQCCSRGNYMSCLIMSPA